MPWGTHENKHCLSETIPVRSQVFKSEVTCRAPWLPAPLPWPPLLCLHFLRSFSVYSGFIGQSAKLGGGHAEVVRELRILLHPRVDSPTHGTYSLVSKVTMIKIGRRFIPPTQLLLHMKLYRTVVNSVPTWAGEKERCTSVCDVTCANDGVNWRFCVSARPSFGRTRFLAAGFCLGKDIV